MYLGLLVDRQFSIITLRNEVLPVAIGSNGTRSSPFFIEAGVDRYPFPITYCFGLRMIVIDDPVGLAHFNRRNMINFLPIKHLKHLKAVLRSL
jgi:hypothetical protein